MSSLSNLRSRGVPKPEPTVTPRGSGVADLTATVKASGKAQPNALAAEKGTIRAMEEAGEEGVQSGAEGLQPKYGEGANRQNLPKEVRGLIASDSYHVP